MNRGGIWGASVLVLGLMCAGAASAQVAADQATVGELIVTARKQSENIMSVPVSMSAVTGATLADYGLSDLHEIDRRVPNFYFAKNSTQSVVGIRGFASYATNFSIDSAIGISLDEVALSSTRWLESGQFDLQQIEVLRGPQGTYFGKNTTAGLLNITTQGPTEHFDGYARAGYENEQRQRYMDLAVGGPIGETFGARLAVHFLKSDGYIKNTFLGGREPQTDSFVGRLSTSWRPFDGLSVSYKVQREETDTAGTAQEVAVCTAGFIAANRALNAPEDCNYNFEISHAGNVPNFSVPFERNTLDIESWLHVLRADLDIGEYAVTSVTSYVKQNIDNRLDPTFSALRYFNLTRRDENKQFTQEVRLQSPTDRAVHFIVGAYYGDIDFRTNDVQAYDTTRLVAVGALPPAFTVQIERYKRFVQDNKTWAVFGEVTWDVTDELHLIVGGRYTNDRKSADILQLIGPMGRPFEVNPVATAQAAVIGFGPLAGSGKRETTNFSPAVTVQYDVPFGQLYVSYKKGFKSGGFDASVARAALLSNFEFRDESAVSYEAGAKARLFDNRLRLTGALYRTEFTDLQLTGILPPTISVLLNAGQARTEGLELEGVWNPGGGVEVYGNLGVADARFLNYTNAPCWTGQTAAQGCVGGVQNNNGKQLGYSPRYTGALGVNWTGDIGSDLKLELGASVNMRSAYNLDIDYDPLVRQAATALFDARAAIGAADDRWSVSLVGRNLFDETYSVGSADVPFFARAMSRVHGLPRTIMVQLGVNF